MTEKLQITNTIIKLEDLYKKVNNVGKFKKVYNRLLSKFNLDVVRDGDIEIIHSKHFEVYQKEYAKMMDWSNIDTYRSDEYNPLVDFIKFDWEKIIYMI